MHGITRAAGRRIQRQCVRHASYGTSAFRDGTAGSSGGGWRTCHSTVSSDQQEGHSAMDERRFRAGNEAPIGCVRTVLHDWQRRRRRLLIKHLPNRAGR